jgi:hypothetical protein
VTETNVFELTQPGAGADQLGQADGTGCDSTRSRTSSRQGEQKVSLFLAGLPLWVAAILLVVLPIDFAPRRIGKVAADESHAHVFICRIASPCVPSILAFCREVEKERRIYA